MNIFVLDMNPQSCAEYHCDKHVVKMPTEYAQILCSVHRVQGVEAPYKLYSKNNPCNVWVRQCIENYRWLLALGMEVCLEYTRRYGKTHKAQAVIEWCGINLPELPNNGDITPFPLVMPEQYRVDDVRDSYRIFYKSGKTFAVWEKTRCKPYWF